MSREMSAVQDTLIWCPVKADTLHCWHLEPAIAKPLGHGVFCPVRVMYKICCNCGERR